MLVYTTREARLEKRGDLLELTFFTASLLRSRCGERSSSCSSWFSPLRLVLAKYLESVPVFLPSLKQQSGCENGLGEVMLSIAVHGPHESRVTYTLEIEDFISVLDASNRGPVSPVLVVSI